MEEIRKGPHRSGENQSLPTDARLITQSGSYQVFVSQEASSVIIVSSDYHPGPLQLDHRDLERFSYELAEEMLRNEAEDEDEEIDVGAPDEAEPVEV
ncbi:MAG: hypothetical protein P1P84_24175 [Deferrisomatales bacterium]|nr:hypothetical protein [Deferrisomatales bacterium]